MARIEEAVLSRRHVFEEDMVSGLPDPARRYLLHAIAPGTALASSVQLGKGRVKVTLFGIVPVMSATGPDATRSARHRLAIESIWLPSSLLPCEGVVWESVDGTHARVGVTIDGEAVPLILDVDQSGSLQEVTMLRHGDVGVPAWQLIPYGTRVEAEAAFGGYTIPTRLRGGWWYGTARYTPDDASVFRISAARFG